MAQVPIPMTNLSSPLPSTSTSHLGRRSPVICPLAKLGRSSPTMDSARYRSPSAVMGYRPPSRNLIDSPVTSYLRGIPSPLEPSIFVHQSSPSKVLDPLGYRNSTSPSKDARMELRNVNSNVMETSFRSFPGLMNEPYTRNNKPMANSYHCTMPSTESRLETQSPFRSPSVAAVPSCSYRQTLETKSSIAQKTSKKNGDASLYQQCLMNKGHAGSEGSLRGSPAPTSTSTPLNYSFIYQNTDLDGSYKIGRSSPSLDQGYHTLVSPSSGPSTSSPWTDYNPLSPSAISAKGKKYSVLKCSLSSSSSLFDKLSDDAVIKIFSWLDSSDLCICARVCKRWKSLAWEPKLWRVIKLSGENVCGDKAVRSVLRRLCGQGTTGFCPTVEKVLLSDGAKITDKGLIQLARRCTELTHVRLHGCSAVTNNAIGELATKCTNLQHLDLTGCSRISCLSITQGPEPPRLLLQYLDLTDCSAIDDGGLKIIVRNCPQLVYLYLRRCVQITDTGIKYLPSFCVMLRELSVSDCNRVTDFALHELAKLGATLRYLSVAKCDQVSDAGLKVIARRCYKLRYLNARGCEAVSDDAITVLARSCPRLRALDIGKCDVSDAGLRAIAECCPNLKKLSLRNCDLVTDRGVQCIAYYCRGLQQLNIQDCQISIEGYRAVKKYCKRCVIEHTNPGFF